jgi:FdhD protein
MHAGFFIGSAADIGSLDMVHLDDAVELRMWLSQPRADRLKEQRRRMAGPTGCGLCGIESIAEAMRPTATIGHCGQSSPGQIMAAMEGLPARQILDIETRTVHAAAFWTVTSGIVALGGRWPPQCARQAFRGSSPCVHCGERGYRTSHQQSIGGDVPKAAAIGAPAMVSISAPTALAVRMADAAGITLAAIARADGFEVFTHPCRIA